LVLGSGKENVEGRVGSQVGSDKEGGEGERKGGGVGEKWDAGVRGCREPFTLCVSKEAVNGYPS